MRADYHMRGISTVDVNPAKHSGFSLSIEQGIGGPECITIFGSADEMRHIARVILDSVKEASAAHETV